MAPKHALFNNAAEKNPRNQRNRIKSDKISGLCCSIGTEKMLQKQHLN